MTDLRKRLADLAKRTIAPAGKVNYSRNTYHEDAQRFIKSAKSKGMTVKAEGGELIAYPSKKKDPLIKKKEYKIPRTPKSSGIGWGP